MDFPPFPLATCSSKTLVRLSYSICWWFSLIFCHKSSCSFANSFNSRLHWRGKWMSYGNLSIIGISCRTGIMHPVKALSYLSSICHSCLSGSTGPPISRIDMLCKVVSFIMPRVFTSERCVASKAEIFRFTASCRWLQAQTNHPRTASRSDDWAFAVSDTWRHPSWKQTCRRSLYSPFCARKLSILSLNAAPFVTSTSRIRS